ncbi:MAG: hypothetical protein EOM17_07310 [Synergistales bacterium]|nr:hypothetical protein [Synergistales bacterium]
MGYRETFANINLDAIKHNIQLIGAKSNKTVFAVVKANAYGHGIIEISKYLEKIGIAYLCVSSLDEAVLLRNNGITSPILILGYVNPIFIKENLQHNITYSVISLEWFHQLISLDIDLSAIKLHIKLDTGMNRLGIKNISELEEIIKISSDFNIKYEGIFSHYHSSEDLQHNYSNKQFKIFEELVKFSHINLSCIFLRNADS